jgi:deoxyribodipyrimidine photo-lyase
MSDPVILWFRRDLRLADHAALRAISEANVPVLPVYVLDDRTPGRWRAGGASRWWLAGSLRTLGAALEKCGSRLILRQGEATAALMAVAGETGARAVFYTRSHEPGERKLEGALVEALGRRGVECRAFPGHLLSEPETLRNRSGDYFKVFTPYWKAALAKEPPERPLPAPDAIPAPARWPASDSLDAWKLEPAGPDWAGGMRETWTPGEAGARERLHRFIDDMLSGYKQGRDTPGVDGTSLI